MERGQVTIPREIRKNLGIEPATLIKIYEAPGEKIVMEPLLEGKKGSLSEFLIRDAAIGKSYWTKEDTEKLKRIRKEATDRVNKIKESL